MTEPAASQPNKGRSRLADVPVEHGIALLRERLYGAISCLATLAVLARYTTDEHLAVDASTRRSRGDRWSVGRQSDGSLGGTPWRSAALAPWPSRSRHRSGVRPDPAGFNRPDPDPDRCRVRLAAHPSRDVAGDVVPGSRTRTDHPGVGTSNGIALVAEGVSPSASRRTWCRRRGDQDARALIELTASSAPVSR